jgi:hypothetical protein
MTHAKNPNLVASGLIVIVGVLVLWVGSLLMLQQVVPDWSTRSQIGDAFGAVNALFSGLAFGGLLLTLLVQRHQISAQQRDFAAQMREIRQSRDSRLQPLLVASFDKQLLFPYPKYVGPENRFRTTFLFRTTLTNASREPALNIQARGTLRVPGIDGISWEDAIPLPLLPDKTEELQMEFVVDATPFSTVASELIVDEGTSVRMLTSRTNRVEVVVSLAFQNALGADVQVEQTFALYVGEDAEIFRRWTSEWRDPAGITPPDANQPQSVRMSAYALPRSFAYKIGGQDQAAS